MKTVSQRLLPWFLSLLFCASSGCAGPDPRASSDPAMPARWRAGFGSAEIALPADSLPLYIAGYHNGWEITEVRDLCRVSALWLDAGGPGVLLLSVDCVGLGSDTVSGIRGRLSPLLEGESVAAVHVIATHDHAGPDTLGLWGPTAEEGKHPGYMENLMTACTLAAQAALDSRKEGRLFRSDVRTEDMLRDSREPVVWDEILHILRFQPDDNSAGIRLFSYGAHAESLRGANTRLSRDYPGVLCDLVRERTGDDALFLPGAVGGLVMTREFFSPFDAEANLLETGERLAGYALSVRDGDERELTPSLSDDGISFTVPLDNTVFLYYKFLGILGNEAVRSDDPGIAGETGYGLRSCLSVLRLGDTALLLLPGEIFPELVFGGGRENPSNPGAENPEPLGRIMERYGLSDFFTVGLADDELGYIVPPNDFLTDPDAPYLRDAEPEDGSRHYEETNSVGIRCAGILAENLEKLLKNCENLSGN
ncbi:MAG: hypothetical protein E7576_14375 [Ruminococcaceae bacterium]|nr:hypothetical protein [Oscillospiraceae bacterium]